MPHHADLAERERHEDTDDVQLDQRGHLGLERHHEQDGDGRQEDDAVGERQSIAAGVQLARQVTVLRQNRSEHRETVERGVGGQHQDKRRHYGDEHEADPEVTEDRLGQLGDQGLLVVVGGRTHQLRGRVLGDLGAGAFGQQDDAHEQGDGDAAEKQQRRGRIA